MIKLIEDNDVVEAINLMNVSVNMEDYKDRKRNEAVWISYFLSLIKKQKEGSPHALVIGDYAKDNQLRGFLSAASFVDFYNNTYIMDVKDCIVDHNYNNAFTVYRLFDYMIDHTKKNGGSSWRADSIRPEEEGKAYAKFLGKRYNTKTHVSVRGMIQENEDETI
jgi:hypothetical protein